MVSYWHGRSAHEYLDLGTDPRVLLKLIWESMNGPSEVELGVHEWSIWNRLGSRFGVQSGYDLGYILVHLGLHFGVHFESMLRSDSDFGFIPPWDQISKALGPILAPLLDPMLAPCWLHVGGGPAS